MDSDLQFDINTLVDLFFLMCIFMMRLLDTERDVLIILFARQTPNYGLCGQVICSIFLLLISIARFKILRSDILKGLELQSDSALINTEILAGLSKCKSDILELPVPHFPRTYGKQSGASLAVVKMLS